MQPAAAPVPHSRQPVPVAAGSWLDPVVFVAAWALPQAALCALAFGESTVPVSPGVGRSLPFAVLPVDALLMLMVPLSTVCLVPLLTGARAHLRRTAPAGRGWPAAWSGTVVAGIALEVFLWRSIGRYSDIAAFRNLPDMDWGALAESVGLVITGAAMAGIMIGATRAASNPEC